MNAMECCKTEGTVDVFQVVKALRIQKPEAVPTMVSQLWHSPHIMMYILQQEIVYMYIGRPIGAVMFILWANIYSALE